jgi:F0F1-type ATP synthase assembly protein I
MKNVFMKYKAAAPWRKRMIKLIVGIVVGAGIGFAYYKFVGCSSGVCPLTSNPFISTLYGAVMGAFIAGMNV